MNEPMNDLDDDLARLFANDELPPQSAEFADEVRRRVSMARWSSALLRIGLGALLLVVAVAVGALIPWGSLYPIQLVYGFVTAPIGAIALLAGIGVVAATR